MTGYLNSTMGSLTPMEPRGWDIAPKSFADNMWLKIEEAWSPDRFLFETQSLAQRTQPMLDRYKEITGEDLANPYDPGQALKTKEYRDNLFRYDKKVVEALKANARRKLQALRDAGHENVPDIDSVDALLHNDAEALRAKAKAADDTWGGFVGGAVGEMAYPINLIGSVLTAPIQLASIPVLAARGIAMPLMRTTAGRILNEALLQAGVNLGLQGVTDALDYISRSRLGTEQTAGELGQNLVGAAVFGGLLGGLFRGGHELWNRRMGQLLPALEELRNTNRLSREQMDALLVAELQRVEDNTPNPLGRGKEHVHDDATDKATHDLAGGNPVRVGDVLKRAAADEDNIVEFTTSRGSRYQRHEDGTTTRTKAARPEHPGDEGLKPRSAKTVYITPELAREIGMWQTSSAVDKQILLTPDGEVVLLSRLTKDAPLRRDPLVSNAAYIATPKRDMSPLELWTPSTPKEGEQVRYANNHPGNPIVEMKTPDPPPAPPVERTPPDHPQFARIKADFIDRAKAAPELKFKDPEYIDAMAEVVARHYVARASGNIGQEPWDLYKSGGPRFAPARAAPGQSQLDPFLQSVDQGMTKIALNVSASTSSIPGLARLQKLSMGHGAKAVAARLQLQDIAYYSLKFLIGGTEAKITRANAMGVYTGKEGLVYEPSVNLTVTFAEKDREAVLAGLAQFGNMFNQEAVHVRGAVQKGTKVGHAYDDGSFNAPMIEWTLKEPLSRQDQKKLYKSSGLGGLTITDKNIIAYYPGAYDDTAARQAFFDAANKLTSGLGERSGGVRTGTARLWRYGKEDGGIAYGAIHGQLRTADPEKGSELVRLIAGRLAGGEANFRPAIQAREITPEQRLRQQIIARDFEAMMDNRLDSRFVEKAYKRLVEALAEQWEALPIKVEVWKGEGRPYPAKPGESSSKQMRHDVTTNNHLWIEKTTPETFGPKGVDFSGHPLLGKSPYKDIKDEPLLWNDVLRAVHDYYAHSVSGAHFGPLGEEAAWLNHMLMTKDPWARWALTTETRGQNSWVNFREGADKMTQEERGFARQKADLLPIEHAMTGDARLDQELLDIVRTNSEVAQQWGTDPVLLGSVNKELAELSKRIPGLKPLLKDMTPEELYLAADGKASEIVRIFEQVFGPALSRTKSAAWAGRAKKGWYFDSANALILLFGAKDAPRFAALLAAMSPQTSVKSNLTNALNMWANWKDAGSPTQPHRIRELLGESVQGGKGQKSVLDAWVNNTIHALTHTDPSLRSFYLSGPKVSSFHRNLLHVTSMLTHDTWVANFYNVLQDVFSKSGEYFGGKGAAYIAASIAMRRAARELSISSKMPWTPDQIQETVWSFIKTTFERAYRQPKPKKGEPPRAPETRSPHEILMSGDITHEMINDTPDFSRLLLQDEFRRILERHYGQELQRLTALDATRVRSDAAGGDIRSAEGSGIAQRTYDRDLRRSTREMELVHERQLREAAERKEREARARDARKAALNAGMPKDDADDLFRVYMVSADLEEKNGPHYRLSDAELRNPEWKRKENESNKEYKKRLQSEIDDYIADQFAGRDVPPPGVERFYQGGAGEAPPGMFEDQNTGTPLQQVVFGQDAGWSGPRFATVVGRRSVRNVDIGVSRINSPEDAAHATMFLSDYPQEHMVILVTDKNGKPLRAMIAGIGTMNSVSMDWPTLAGWAANVPGGEHVWLSHNHPAGISKLSGDLNKPKEGGDIWVEKAFDELTRGSGLKFEGILAVTPDSFSHFSTRDMMHIDQQPMGLPPAGKGGKVKIEERVFKERGELGPRVLGTQVLRDERQAFTGGQEGVLLLNNQLMPVAFVPIDLSQAIRIRGTPQHRMILGALEKANANNAIIYMNNDFFGASGSGAENLQNMLARAGVAVHDILLPSNGSVRTLLGQLPKLREGAKFYQAGDEEPKQITLAMLKDFGFDELEAQRYMKLAKREAKGKPLSAPEQHEFDAYNVRLGFDDPDDIRYLPWDQTRLETFKRFFRDSKVVDEAGEPLQVNHGTDQSFDAFRRGDGDVGMHFGTAGQAEDRLDATRRNLNANFMPMYLSIQNPIRMDDLDTWWASRVMRELKRLIHTGEVKIPKKEWKAVDDLVNEIESKMGDTRDAEQLVVDLMEKHGYDGIVYKNKGEVTGGKAARADVDRLYEEARVKVAQRKRTTLDNVTLFEGQDLLLPEVQRWQYAQRHYDQLYEHPTEDSWIIFRPTQAKSAIGNDGGFDPKNPIVYRQEGELQAGPGGARGSVEFDREGALVRLFKAQNRSTFFHEAGHIFLQELIDDVRAGVAGPQKIEDLNTLMKWWGIDSIDQIDLGPGGHHEMTARGFEQWAREGKAPSTALARVFQKLKEWLTEIYTTAKELNVERTEAVDQVFERFLATDLEIQARQFGDAGIKPLPAGIKAQVMAAPDAAKASLEPDVVKTALTAARRVSEDNPDLRFNVGTAEDPKWMTAKEMLDEADELEKGMAAINQCVAGAA